MENTQKIKKFNIFIITGLIISIVYILIIFIVEILYNGYSISFNSLRIIHKENVILWLIDFLPLTFFILTYQIGRWLTSSFTEFQEQIDFEQKNSKKTLDFIEQLRLGNTNVKFEASQQKDKLSRSLNNLRNEIVRSKDEDDTRQKEEKQRNWKNEGLAKFGAILRENLDNLEKLTEEITSNLSKYLNAKQAGFFLLKEEKNEKYFVMSAFFAYDRKKYPEKKFLWGEGLIGACALVKKTIFLTDTSNDFVDITSGLGKANPRSIILVPLKDDEDNVHGIIELASFKIFEEYEREFIFQVAESIASTLANIKINMRTSELLKESQKQAELMAQQEDKMRRNMEELKITQIEAAKQGKEFRSFTNSVNHTLIRAEYNLDGILTYANTKFIEILQYDMSSEIEGKHILTFIHNIDREWFASLWDRLRKGGKHFEGDMKHISKKGKEIWTMATYVSIRDEKGEPEKILFLGIDRTNDKIVNIDYQGQIEALNRSSIKATFKPDASIIELNERYLSLLEIDSITDNYKSLFDILSAETHERFQVIWKRVLRGKASEGRQKIITKSKKELWFRGTYTVVLDIYEQPAKIVYIGYNITQQVKIEQENKEQTLILKKQEKELQKSKIELAQKLQETKNEVRTQYQEIETVKILNDKMLHDMLDAVVTVNQDNYIIFFNHAAEELWNVKQNIVLGKKIKYLIPPDTTSDTDKDELVPYIGEYFKAGAKSLIGKRREVYMIDKNQQKQSVLITMSEATVGNRYNLSAFIQKIEIEFF